jgi:hypothetical protein
MMHPHDRIHTTHIAIDFNRPYLLLALVYMGGIYWLSSLSDLVVRGVDANLLHIPLYAGLAFCLLNAMSETRPQPIISWRLLGLVFVSAAAYAALDEWHQSFVFGRDASLGDFSLDLLGIGLMLVLSRL